MQRATAERLQKEWGAIDCDHSLLDHEYEAGDRTGNLVCLICGEAFSERRLALAIYVIYLVSVSSLTNVPETIKLLLEHF